MKLENTIWVKLLVSTLVFKKWKEWDAIKSNTII